MTSLFSPRGGRRGSLGMPFGGGGRRSSIDCNSNSGKQPGDGLAKMKMMTSTSTLASNAYTNNSPSTNGSCNSPAKMDRSKLSISQSVKRKCRRLSLDMLGASNSTFASQSHSSYSPRAPPLLSFPSPLKSPSKRNGNKLSLKTPKTATASRRMSLSDALPAAPLLIGTPVSGSTVKKSLSSRRSSLNNNTTDHTEASYYSQQAQQQQQKSHSKKTSSKRSMKSGTTRRLSMPQLSRPLESTESTNNTIVWQRNTQQKEIPTTTTEWNETERQNAMETITELIQQKKSLQEDCEKVIHLHQHYVTARLSSNTTTTTTCPHHHQQKIGAVVSMKQVLKYESKRDHAKLCQQQLQQLLNMVQSQRLQHFLTALQQQQTQNNELPSTTKGQPYWKVKVQQILTAPLLHNEKSPDCLLHEAKLRLQEQQQQEQQQQQNDSPHPQDMYQQTNQEGPEAP